MLVADSTPSIGVDLIPNLDRPSYGEETYARMDHDQ